VAATDEDKLSSCPVAEQDKQAGIGMAIICTTMAAMLSGYFAFYSFLKIWYAALPVALFWGFLIFNIDRIMVSSMRKDPDGKWWRELLPASPRIALAALIALLIAKPVEVKIFEKQIVARENSLVEDAVAVELARQDSTLGAGKSQLANIKKDREELEAKGTDCFLDPGYKAARDEYQQCDQEFRYMEESIKGKLAALNTLRRSEAYSYVNEEGLRVLNDRGIRRRKSLNVEINELRSRQRALACNEKQKKAEKLCTAYMKRMGANIDTIKIEESNAGSGVRRYEVGVNSIREQVKSKIQLAMSDILGQLKILDVIKKDNSSMLWASWLIVVLFFVLETAPLFVKIISPRGKYDSLLRITEQYAFDHEKAEINLSGSHKQARIDTANVKSAELADQERKMNEEVMGKIIKENNELAQAIVDKWKAVELNKLNNDPDYLNNCVSV
jgi:hypothetical protein